MALQNLSSGTGNVFAVDGIIFMIAFLAGIYFTWWAVGILHWEKFVHDPYGAQAKVLRFLMSLFGGLTLGVVAVMYVLATQALRGML